MDIAYKLKTLRQQKGLTTSEMAGLVGVTRQTVGNWERNKYSPSVNKILQICKIYDIEINYFDEKNLKDSENIRFLAQELVAQREKYFSLVTAGAKIGAKQVQERIKELQELLLKKLQGDEDASQKK